MTGAISLYLRGSVSQSLFFFQALCNSLNDHFIAFPGGIEDPYYLILSIDEEDVYGVIDQPGRWYGIFPDTQLTKEVRKISVSTLIG